MRERGRTQSRPGVLTPGGLRTVRSPSIRALGLTQVALVLLVGGALVWVTVLVRRTAADRTAAETGRVRSFALADQMRQSSNDLTRMVRIHVGTGDDRYRRYYETILAIRRGPSAGEPGAAPAPAVGPVLDHAVLGEFTDDDEALRDELVTD